uniref:Uncharacterized protein n=1 Tax=Anguilla anguilla TaxID=7936 RepID=A0A0E9X6W3_ANGAN
MLYITKQNKKNLVAIHCKCLDPYDSAYSGEKVTSEITFPLITAQGLISGKVKTQNNICLLHQHGPLTPVHDLLAFKCCDCIPSDNLCPTMLSFNDI